LRKVFGELLRRESRVFGNPCSSIGFGVATIHPRWFGEDITSYFFIELNHV
jgi:hypothetical protein